MAEQGGRHAAHAHVQRQRGQLRALLAVLDRFINLKHLPGHGYRGTEQSSALLRI